MNLCRSRPDNFRPSPETSFFLLMPSSVHNICFQATVSRTISITTVLIRSTMASKIASPSLINVRAPSFLSNGGACATLRTTVRNLMTKMRRTAQVSHNY